MFILLALLAFINAQNDAYIKEEENASSGESLISNDEGISSNSDNVVDDNTNSTDGSNSSINDGGASSNIDESSVLNDEGASSNNDESSVLNDGGASSNNEESSVLNDEGASSNNEESSVPVEDSTITDEYHPGDSGSESSISPSLKLLLENLNDILNNGISKKVFSKYFDEPDEALNSYSYYIDIISNKSYVLFNGDEDGGGEYSRFFDAEATLYSTSRSIRDFLNESKPAFKIGKSILSDLGPDVAKALNIDFNLIESLYNYILVNDENDGVKFGTILDKLGISKNWIPNVKKAISVFDNGAKISDLFDALGVTTQYNDFINKFSKLKVPNKEDDIFISINYASDSIKSAITLFRTAYNNLIKTYYDDLILPIIKKYGLKPADIFEGSIKTRASSLVSALDKLQKYSNACEKEEKSDLEEVQCLVYEEVIDQFKWDFCDTLDYNSNFNQSCLNNIPNTLKGYVSDYTAAEINLTNILINKYKIDEEYVGLISTMIADVLDSNKNFKSILEDTTKYLGKIKISDQMTYSQLVSRITYTIDFISALSGSSDFYNVVDRFGFSEAWKNAAYFVLEISTVKPLCNLSFIDEYDYEECQSYSTNVLDQMKKYLSDKSKFKDFLPNDSPGFNSFIEGAIYSAKLFSKTLPEFLKSAYENVGFPYLNQTFAEEYNLTIPKTVDFSKVITTTFDIMNELVSLVDFLFPYAARELPVVSQYYPIFIQKTQQILDAFKTAKTIPTIANTFYDGIGVIFEMIGNAANAYDGPETLVLDVVKKATPTSFLNLHQTATKLMAIENLTLHNIADAITYDGSNNVAKLLADSRTLTINDIAPYKSLVKHSGELYTSMSANHLTLDTISKCLAASKDGIADMLKSLISPALGYPRQFILNIVKNYLRSNDEEVGSYFDKIRRMAASVANGRLIATSTEDIVVTPAPTPAPTQKPVEPDYKPIIDTGLKTEIEGGNVTKNKEVIENLFKDEQGNKISGAITVDVTGDNFTFGDEIKLDPDQLIMITENKPIDYKGGQLNILFKDTSVETEIHVEDASNIQLSINSNNNVLGEKVIKIESKEATSINIASTSEISTPFVIKVTEKVKEVSIDAIQLHYEGTISASKTVKNDEDEEEVVPVQIKVTNLKADAGTKATLSMLTVKNEFNIRQKAQLDFQDVTFEEGAKINLQLESAGTENFENPIITGQIPKPPAEIILSKPEGILYEGRDYTLFAGTFVEGCESWSNAITNLADTGFTSKKCNDPLLAQGEDKRLDLQYQPDSGKGGNKLSKGAIAGIVVGCVAAVAIVVVVVIIVIRKKKQQNASSDENGGKDDAEI